MCKEPAPVLAFKHAGKMDIHIILSYNDEVGDWSVEIDGHLHVHISTEVIEALVEYKLIVAYSLLESLQCSDHGESVN